MKLPLAEIEALVSAHLQAAGAGAAMADSTARALVLAEAQGLDGVRLPGGRREALRRRAEAEGVEVVDALLAQWRGG